MNAGFPPDAGDGREPDLRLLPTRGSPGVMVAGLTALISGISVFVNSYGVHAIASPSVYTTAKNLVAALVLAGCVLAARGARGLRSSPAARRFVTASGHLGPTGMPDEIGGPEPRSTTAGDRRWYEPARWLGLGFVGIVGGGIAFVLFFEGLARSSATPAAFLHDTMVVWVAVLAMPFLRERIAWWNIAAIALLLAGQIALDGGVGHLMADEGQLLILGATMLWTVEVVVAKVLLRDMDPGTISVVRMAVGALTLLVYLAVTGTLGALVSLDARQVGWALITGLFLAAYVGTWMTALSRARALDVTSVLVASALVTAVLQAISGKASLEPHAIGLVLILAGAGVVSWMALRHPQERCIEVAGR